MEPLSPTRRKNSVICRRLPLVQSCLAVLAFRGARDHVGRIALDVKAA